MLWLLNGLLYLHFTTFLLYLTTLLRQWDRPIKRVSILMLYCGIGLLLTGIGLVAVRYPAVIYWKVVLKSGLLVIIAGITASHRANPLSQRSWQVLLGLTVLAALIALWRVA